MDFKDKIRFPVVEARDAVAELIIRQVKNSDKKYNSGEISALTHALAELNKTIK